MKMVLPDGTAVECTTDECIELKSKGFLNSEKKDKTEIKVKRMAKFIKELQPTKTIKNLARKHFSRQEDKIISQVWNERKNKIRLTNKEYKNLENLIPGRTRKTIGARLFRLRHSKKLL